VSESPNPAPAPSAGGDVDEPTTRRPITSVEPTTIAANTTAHSDCVAFRGATMLTRPCANAVSGFVNSFDEGSNKQMPKPGTVDMPKEPEHYETLKPGMTEEEIKAAMERSKARAAGSGSAAPPAAKP